jgi:RNA polymerase sigma factor (sigma-70 family)
MFNKWRAESGAGRVQSAERGEAQLVGLIAGGDRAAFQTLYRSYFARLARFLDRMTRNVPLIEEIINDTMMVVWQKADSYDHSCKVSTWIFAIAYRQGLKAVKRVDEPVEELIEQQGEAWREPEFAVEQLQLRQGIGEALAALPLEQRVAISLTYYHDMDYKEIAETMGCPVNTVKTRMFHARRRLRDLLSAHMEAT